jgi:predicted amidophosphoribosyltransferase
LFAAILLALVPSRARAAGEPTTETHVKCPDCAEFVLKEGRVCKHCGYRLVPQVPAAAGHAAKSDHGAVKSAPGALQ